MKIPARSVIRGACGLYGFLLAFAVPQTAIPATPIEDLPLFLSVSVPPNVVLTLDDSGSMRRAFVPENCLADTSDCAHLDNRYEKSAKRNLIYYDPNETYPAPRTGVGNNTLTTSFTAAYRNGFDPTWGGTVDLSTNYKPTAYLDLVSNTATEAYMGHYGSDVVRCTSTNPSVTGQCQVRSASNPAVWTNASPARSCRSHARCAGAQPGSYTDSLGTNVDPIGVPAYYYKFDSTNNAACLLANAATNNACYDLVYVSATSGPGGTDERQNFANWYSFARTRNLATATSAAIAFADLDPSVRVAWQGLNSCRGSATSLVDTDCDGWKNNFSGKSNAIRPFSVSQHKSNFYSWLFQQPTAGGTPLPEAMKRVGDYYRSNPTAHGSPYDDDLTNNTINTATSCRRNYHILMTDGIWTTAATIGNEDGTATSFPDTPSPTYTVGAGSRIYPYWDNTSNTLADVAFKYWSEDLQITLDNNLIPKLDNDPTDANDTARFWNPRNNPAKWQHMVNFTIGLGLTGYLAEEELIWDESVIARERMYNGSYPQLRSGSIAWPAASTATNNAANVADLWHAAINSRGKFFSADNPAQLATAFTEALNDIATSSGSSAALSSNSTSINPNDTYVYQAKFSSDWSGTLLAVEIEKTGVVGEQKWDAALLTPAPNARKIYTYRPDTLVGAEFSSCSNLSASQQLALNTSMAGVVDNLCADRLAWLRGDTAKETRFSGGVFRSRPVREGKTIVMGDVINSDPAYVKNTDYGYSLLPAGTPGQSTYASFLATTRPATVFVGSNDGKLYAIDAETGVERFAYIPAAVFPNLSALTDPGYSHRYYVDGGITVGDAYVGGSWRTLLVAGLNAGGRSIYALDVTDPVNFNATKVLWEYTDADLGLTFSQPQIGILEKGQWVAVFANGYNSPSGGAYLYVVNLENGALLQRIELDDVDGVDESNGVSTPLLHDADDNGLIDTVYAGDLLGNMWKVDVSGDPGTWGVALGGQPLFTAALSPAIRQPITSQPSVTEHKDGGFLVTFGTGRYLASSDIADNSVQTFYAVRDNNVPVNGGRSDLVEQTIDSVAVVLGRNVRSSSTNTVDWTTDDGWYIDLVVNGVADGERVVSKPLLQEGRAIFVTIVPSNDPCEPGGTSWLMELDLFTGAAQCVFDLDGDGVFEEEAEMIDGATCAAGLQLTVGISKTPVWLDPDISDPDAVPDPIKVVTGTKGTIETIRQKGTPPPPVPPTIVTPAKRRSWIQIR